MTRLKRDDGMGFRMVAERASGDVATFAASVASLRGLLGEIDFLRAELAAARGEPVQPPATHPPGQGAVGYQLVTTAFGEVWQARTHDTTPHPSAVEGLL